MTIEEQIAFFFAPPLPEQEGTSRSILHLVRREAQDCFIGKICAEEAVVAEARKECHRLFATTMVIMAGIDLLAKCYAGSDERGQVTQRFMAFAERFIFAGLPSASELSKVLYYGCRNPMVHSFSLYNRDFRIQLTTRFDSGVVRRVRDVPDFFVISIEGLYAAFTEACRRYEVAVRSDQDLQTKFALIFHNYGQIQFQTTIVEPVAN